MIIGKLHLSETAPHTHNDSYVLAGITAVSTRRPFLTTGLALGALGATFSIAFLDILYPAEIVGLALASFLSLAGGFCIGQLRLVSRDLRGSPVDDVVFGTYGHLNRLRPQIADAVERAKSGGVS